MANRFDKKQVEISSINQLHAWLAANHRQRESIWLITFKKHAADKYVPRGEVIDEMASTRRRRIDDTARLAAENITANHPPGKRQR